jgi:hypothetical protein
MTSDKCETYLYLTLGVLGQTKKICICHNFRALFISISVPIQLKYQNDYNFTLLNGRIVLS